MHIKRERGRFAKDDGVGKTCIVCNTYKELSAYYKTSNSRARRGFVYMGKCIFCYNLWRVGSGATKRYRCANKTKVLEASRKWRAKYPERLADLCRKWRLENPEKKRDLSLRYKAKKRGATVEPVNLDLVLVKAKGKCHICGYLLDGDISYDHIYPLNKGGQHSHSNLACSHLRCNLKKSDKTLIDFLPSLLLDASGFKRDIWF